MSSGHGHEPPATATDAASDTDRDTAIVVTTAEAARLAGVSPRTIRRWIAQGWLPATESEQGHLVSPADLPLAAERARRGRGHGHGHDSQQPGHEPERGHEQAATATATAMTTAGRAQLDAIMQEWLAPLIDRIATLEREAGHLEAGNQAQAEVIATQQARLAEMQRRAELAEQEAATLRARLSPPVVAQDEPKGDRGTSEPSTAESAPGDGLWARLGRWWRGAGA